MRRAVPVLFLSLVPFLAEARAPADAPEQERDGGPCLATGAPRVGARGVPDVALLLAWALDVGTLEVPAEAAGEERVLRAGFL